MCIVCAVGDNAYCFFFILIIFCLFFAVVPLIIAVQCVRYECISAK